MVNMNCDASAKMCFWIGHLYDKVVSADPSTSIQGTIGILGRLIRPVYAVRAIPATFEVMLTTPLPSSVIQHNILLDQQES